MKKIKFIKENDLLNWKIGEIHIQDEWRIINDEIWISSRTGEDQICLRTSELIKKGYAQWIVEEIEDFYEAWWYIQDKLCGNGDLLSGKHNGEPASVLFSHSVQNVIDIQIIKINPESGNVDNDETKNTETKIWLEFGFPEYDENLKRIMFVHDIHYDIEGKTFEEAIIKLATNKIQI